MPWIGIKDATGNHGRAIFDTVQHTNAAGIANSSARVLPANTVCLSRTASVGYVVVMGKPMATSQDFVNWVCSENLDYRFLKYVFLAERRAFLRFASGTTHQTIYFPEAKAFHVCLPPIPEQRAIAHILGTLDDKIELNRRMNETLEALARAIFKSWFVDFDPVRAKMAGRKPVGMDAETAALFPDRMQDSEIGEIPAGWAVSTVGNEVRVVGGSTPSTSVPEYWQGGTIHWATPKDMANLRAPILLSSERRITDRGVTQIGSGVLPAGTVLLSSRAPIGYLATTEIPVAINQGFIAMICDRRLPNHYVRLWTAENLEVILARANGSTFLEISKSNFRPIPILVPPSLITAAFEAIAHPLHRRVVCAERQSATLATLRDTLLPKLLSGELRIPDAEKLVEAAT